MKKKIICVGTTLYKIVNQSHIDGGYMKKVLSQALGNRKAIGSLGHFLYAVQAPLKMPQ